MTRKVVSNTRFTVVFRRIFPLFFFRDSRVKKPTQVHTSGFSHQTKIYKICTDKIVERVLLLNLELYTVLVLT